ncbi:unnamed protein product, partial [marine sediment metagenome]
ITINIYPITTIPNWSTISTDGIIFRVEVINENIDSINNQNFTFTILPNTTFSVNENFAFLFIPNITAENWNFAEKWLECKDNLDAEGDKSRDFERGWQNCQNDLVEYEGENATSCKEELGVCLLNVQSKDIEITGKEDKITNLEGEKETTKNSKWFYGVIGIALGIGGLLVYQGKLGKGSAKDKSETEFNKGQQG